MGLLLTDHNFLPHAEAMILAAQRTIDIATYKAELTTKPRGKSLIQFFNTIIQKAKQGIKVRVLLNWNSERRSVAKTNLYVMRELKGHNIEVRHLKYNRCCHAKVIITDSKKVIIGSHNLSVRSCHNNFELSYLIPDPETVKEISEVYQHSWYDAQKI